MSNPGSVAASPGISGAKVSYIPTEENIANAAFSYLATPDKVSGIVVKPGGFIAMCFTAYWHAAAAGFCQAGACIVVNDAQLTGVFAAGAPIAAPTNHNPANGKTNADGSCDSGSFAGSSFTRPIYTVPEGLATDNSTPGSGGESWVNNVPQLMGNFTGIWVPPAGGTFSVGIKWKLVANTFHAHERRLVAFAVNP